MPLFSVTLFNFASLDSFADTEEGMGADVSVFVRSEVAQAAKLDKREAWFPRKFCFRIGKCNGEQVVKSIKSHSSKTSRNEDIAFIPREIAAAMVSVNWI